MKHTENKHNRCKMHNRCTTMQFVTCVCQLNAVFCFYLISFFMNSRTSPGGVVFGVVPGKNVGLCPIWSGLSSSHLSPVKTIIGAPGKVVYLHYTTHMVYWKGQNDRSG